MNKNGSSKLPLFFYDILILLAVEFVFVGLYRGIEALPLLSIIEQTLIAGVCVFTARYFGGIYRQIWRYGGIQCYIRLLFVDGLAFLATVLVEVSLPIRHLTFGRLLAVACLNLLGALSIRMVYRYAYKCQNVYTQKGRILRGILKFFAGDRINLNVDDGPHKIRIAIVGAGRVGVSLAEDLINNPNAAYIPRCFIDSQIEKAGREIHGIPVFMEDKDVFQNLQDFEIQEIVIAIPELTEAKKRSLYEFYRQSGCKVKLYDYPVMQSAGEARRMREFDIEDLLFRKPISISSGRSMEYYRDKTVLITGGGGSIGSELCRQLARMNPKQIILLDIYENGVYDVQQELKIKYGSELDLQVEIVSITNRSGLERVFKTYRPQIIINAAAHKHVPLMEHNCIEAVENNVFGTLNLIGMAERYGAERFMMISTDKAVNPTNVMGATKRMCEMMVQSASAQGHVSYSATRFGNVLGSAGSVIPLFKRQIANGGPVTITDKRITRYFMTIQEATQLVLESGALAKNGELFALEMGQPVKILDLAENMIRLSGMPNIQIIETGLRPGEKLYEEVLIKTEQLDKTENDLIFIERDKPYAPNVIEEKLAMLRDACETNDDEEVRRVLKVVVPSYKCPEDRNLQVENQDEPAYV